MLASGSQAVEWAGARGRGRENLFGTYIRPLVILLTFPAPGRIDASAFECCENAGAEKSLLWTGCRGRGRGCLGKHPMPGRRRRLGILMRTEP